MPGFALFKKKRLFNAICEIQHYTLGYVILFITGGTGFYGVISHRKAKNLGIKSTCQ